MRVYSIHVHELVSLRIITVLYCLRCKLSSALIRTIQAPHFFDMTLESHLELLQILDPSRADELPGGTLLHRQHLATGPKGDSALTRTSGCCIEHCRLWLRGVVVTTLHG